MHWGYMTTSHWLAWIWRAQETTGGRQIPTVPKEAWSQGSQTLQYLPHRSLLKSVISKAAKSTLFVLLFRSATSYYFSEGFVRVVVNCWFNEVEHVWRGRCGGYHVYGLAWGCNLVPKVVTLHVLKTPAFGWHYGIDCMQHGLRRKTIALRELHSYTL